MNLTIERIEAIPLRMPLPKPLKAGTVVVNARATVLTRVHTAEGIVGECFSNNEDRGQPEIVRLIGEEILPRLKGRSAFHVEACWEAMYPITRDFLRDRRMPIRAIACVDAALWDAVGKAVGLPLHRLWGGMRDEVPAVAMGAYYNDGNDLQIVHDEMAMLRRQGFAGCKLKIGRLSPEQDALRVRAAREGAGDGFWLIPDPNQGYSFDEAVRFARLVEDLDIHWLEEPCHWQNDMRDLARLRAITGVRVAAGQSEVTGAGCRDLLVANAIDVCNFDPSWSGGPTEWRKVAATAALFGVGIYPHLETQVGAALAASVSNGLYVEVMQPNRDPLYHALIENPPRIADGKLTLSELPGWGMELDRALIDRIRCDR
ncbi:mandelate racemase/muconate lactonizing enzyme family protein [Pigmentiphaga soli]|uniref:Mandelate racemase/muconate lactonizing enzyme family protein n=1 Tax=Pigmentiphaga soli TaxID=1007095 RepID=A0ABP8H3X7_9BURK